MRDAYEVLRQKEMELARVRHEIESLRIVAPLLSVADDHVEESGEAHESEDEKSPDHSNGEATGTDGLPSFSTMSHPKIWNVLKRGK